MGAAPAAVVTDTRTNPVLSFRDLAREQLPRLVSLARRLVGEDAEDVVQDCLLKSFRKFDQLHDTAAAPAWLTSILVSCCRDRTRTRARQPVEIDFDQVERFSLYRKIADEDPFPYSGSLHLDFLAEFSREDVRAVLMRLPELYRIPLVVVYMDGYLARELAEMLGVPLGTVLARLHRGRKLFEGYRPCVGRRQPSSLRRHSARRDHPRPWLWGWDRHNPGGGTYGAHWKGDRS